MFDPLSIVGNASNVRVNPDYSNPAPPQPTVPSDRYPGHTVTLSNSGSSAHGFATWCKTGSSRASTPQPHILEGLEDGFEPGNKSFDPIAYSSKDTIGTQTVPHARYDQLSKNFTASRARNMQAISSGPTTRYQLSVGAPFQTPGQNNIPSAGDEWSKNPVDIGDRMFWPAPHPKDNLHGINIQYVPGCEEFERIHSPSKTKHLVGDSSYFLPRCSSPSEETRATSKKCWPPSPLKIRWKLALLHLQGKELLVRCRSSATTYYMIC